ncbi:MAG TPA: hypothetical protein VFU88_14135 [Ktedonobacterales bacterium]|nr:hypothetical protein [Ktedonobacterales bacterium]
MYVPSAVQQVLFAAFAFTWLGVGAVLFLRTRVVQNAYLRRFEHEIDFHIGDPIFIPGSLRAYRAIGRVMREPQPDPELERHRREIYRRFRYYLIWIFGFPPIVFAVMALALTKGLVHSQ